MRYRYDDNGTDIIGVHACGLGFNVMPSYVSLQPISAYRKQGRINCGYINALIDQHWLDIDADVALWGYRKMHFIDTCTSMCPVSCVSTTPLWMLECSTNWYIH